MKSMLASMAVVLAFCAAPAAAAEFPKTGSAEYDTYYVDNTVEKIDSGAGTGVIGEETGITRNVKGEGPFHDMSVRCLYHWSVVGETNHFNGSCVETDKDGDNVFTTFDDKNHYLMGGTGKYKGITGTVPYTFRGTSRGGRRPRGLYRQPQGHLGDQITEAAADCSEPCQGVDGRISTGPAKVDQSDQGYNSSQGWTMRSSGTDHLGATDRL